MSDQDEELRDNELMSYASEWADITKGIEKADVGPLVQYLRRGNPVSKDVLRLLADLFDPEKPMGIYARIILVGGNTAETIRNCELNNDCDAWLYENKLNRIPHKQWEIFQKKYGIQSVVATKAARLKGRKIAKKIEESIS